MPMKTHRATRLAEIDEEINSRPYGNLFTKWLSGRAARENIGPKIMKYGPSTARLVHYDQSNKLALYLQFYSCYSFALVLYKKFTRFQPIRRA